MSLLMAMTVDLVHMLRVIMIVQAVCARVIMVMPGLTFSVVVFVRMLVPVLVTVNVSMFMPVHHISVQMVMGVAMFMLMPMVMLMLVISFHVFPLFCCVIRIKAILSLASLQKP